MRRSVTLPLIVAILLFALLVPLRALSQELPECSNGVDDDGDQLVDYPADPSCLAPDGAREGGGIDAGVPDLAQVDGFGDFAVPRDLADVDLTGVENGRTSGEESFATPGFPSPAQSRGCAFPATRGQGLNAFIAGALLLLLLRGRRSGT
jgi:hypothetical protein